MQFRNKTVKFGKLPTPADPNMPKFSTYVRGPLPTVPATVSWIPKNFTAWGMMLNDSLGCCTVSAMGHAIQSWSGDESGNVITVPDPVILQAYEVLSGYKPGQPDTDTGCDMNTVVQYWQRVGLGGYRIAGAAQVDPKSAAFDVAADLFGGLYLGVSLPDGLVNNDDLLSAPWVLPDVIPTDGSWDPNPENGHCIYLAGYDQTKAPNAAGGYSIVTWGEIAAASTAFLQKYCDTAYAVIGNQWVLKGRAPSGFNVMQLMADLRALGGGGRDAGDDSVKKAVFPNHPFVHIVNGVVNVINSAVITSTFMPGIYSVTNPSTGITVNLGYVGNPAMLAPYAGWAIARLG